MLLQNLYDILTNDELMGYYYQGFAHTLLLAFSAALIGLVLGFIVALIKISAQEYKFMKIPAVICDLYTTVVRGTPVALQLFIMVFAILAIPNFTVYAAIITFGINSGAYVSENIRAGILSVDKGQMEAGRAVGMSWLQTMVHIVVPQAVKNIIPAIGNEMIALLKETSIISMVGSTVGTLTFDLNAAANEVFLKIPDFLTSGIIAGCFYLIVVYLIVFIFKMIERRLRANER